MMLLFIVPAIENMKKKRFNELQDYQSKRLVIHSITTKVERLVKTLRLNKNKQIST